MFAGGLKVAKLPFHHSKLRKQNFLQKDGGKMSNFKILGGLALTSDAHAPKMFYNEKAKENKKNAFTNKHIMNFENTSL